MCNNSGTANCDFIRIVSENPSNTIVSCFKGKTNGAMRNVSNQKGIYSATDNNF